MVVAPKCRVCDNGKILSWGKVFGCRGPRCLRTAFKKTFCLYHCAKHKGVPPAGWVGSICVECAADVTAAQNSEGK